MISPPLDDFDSMLDRMKSGNFEVKKRNQIEKSKSVIEPILSNRIISQSSRTLFLPDIDLNGGYEDFSMLMFE